MAEFSFKKGIDYSLVKPLRKDFDSWDNYFKNLNSYLILKYKDTYSKGNIKHGN
jgi:hypothetical protein